MIYASLLAEFGILVFFTDLGLIEFQVKNLTLVFLFLVIDSFGWFWMGGFDRDIADRVYPGVPEGSIFGSTLFPIYMDDIPDDVIFNIVNYADHTTLYSKFHL